VQDKDLLLAHKTEVSVPAGVRIDDSGKVPTLGLAASSP